MRVLTTLLLTIITFSLNAQKVTGKLVFQPGQQLTITTKNTSSNFVNAMGNEIEMKSESSVDQIVRVTNTTEESHTLSQELKRIRMTAGGMGEDINFDSDSEKDMKGAYGSSVKELMGKKLNLVIDASGNTLMAVAEGGVSKKTEAAAGMLAQFMGEISSMTDAPKQGEASFFKVLPASEVGVGDGWTNTIERNGTKTEEAYSVASINDDVILLNFLSNSSTVRVQETMGMEVNISMKNKTEGTITVDRKTGILKEKNLKTTSAGAVSTGMGEFPINATSTMVVTVN